MTPYDRRNELEIVCPHCGATFFVPKSMKSGIANCPHCQLAVQLPGGFEAEFWVLWWAGMGFVVLVSWGMFAAAGLWPGIATFLVGALILGVITLAS